VVAGAGPGHAFKKVAAVEMMFVRIFKDKVEHRSDGVE